MPGQNIEPNVQFFCEILGHQNVGDGERKRTDAFTGFGGEHFGHREQIKWIGHQNIQGIGRNTYDPATTNLVDRALDGFNRWTLRIYFY
jgi:hypothetical protein